MNQDAILEGQSLSSAQAVPIPSLTECQLNRAVSSRCHRTVLENGLVVLAVENPAADIVAARIFLRAGSLWEAGEQAGLSHLVATVLTKGTEQRSAQEIAECVESVGASLGMDAATDYLLLSLKTVSADFANILALAGELLRSPNFPEAEVELERRLTLQSIQVQQEQPMTVALDQLRRAMYQNHPYAQSSLGAIATVAQLERADLQSYHQTYFRPDNLVISIAGRITPAQATTLVNQVFGDWQIPSTMQPTLELAALTPQPQHRVTTQQTQQSIVMLGYLAPSVRSPDYAALKVLSTYLGNGLSSRLFVELREKRGLAYEVSAFYPPRFDTSHFGVYMGTAAENTAIALESLQAEVNRLRDVPLSEDELAVAKSKILGQYALGKQTNAQIAQVLGWYEILGLGVEYDLQFQADVAAVTVEAAYQAACQYFIPPYVSLVGPGPSVQGLLNLKELGEYTPLGENLSRN